MHRGVLHDPKGSLKTAIGQFLLYWTLRSVKNLFISWLLMTY